VTLPPPSTAADSSESEELYRALVELSPDAVFVIQDGYHVFANARGIALLGGTGLADLSTRPALEFMHGTVRTVAESRLSTMTEDRQKLPYVEEQIVTLRGDVLDIEAAGTPVTFRGRPAALVVVRDITARKQAEQALRAAQERFSAAFRHAPIGMAVLDRDATLLEVNPALGELLGRSERELVGSPALAVVHPEDRPAAQQLFEQLRTGVDRVNGSELRCARPGGYRWVQVSTSAQVDRDGPPTRFIVQLLDIDGMRSERDELTRRALHDHLTGLPNRQLFLHRLATSLDSLGDGGSVTVLFVDLDGFKAVNDTLGHAAGDELLVAVSERLRSVLREQDTVARLGGDEFGIVLSDRDRSVDVSALAARICGAIAEPFALSAGRVRVTASLGLATTGDEHHDAAALVADADVAMYSAKGRRSTAAAAGSG